MTDGASCFNNGPECKREKCAHPSHQVGTEPERWMGMDVAIRPDMPREVLAMIGTNGNYALIIGIAVDCPHGLPTTFDSCSVCVRSQRELAR